jgi:hypothetical protein
VGTFFALVVRSLVETSLSSLCSIDARRIELSCLELTKVGIASMTAEMVVNAWDETAVAD